MQERLLVLRLAEIQRIGSQRFPKKCMGKGGRFRPDVPEELFNSLRAHFSPQQMVELTSADAWENFRARFNRGFGIEAERLAEGAGCAVRRVKT